MAAAIFILDQEAANLEIKKKPKKKNQDEDDQSI